MAYVCKLLLSYVLTCQHLPGPVFWSLPAAPGVKSSIHPVGHPALQLRNSGFLSDGFKAIERKQD